MVLATPEAALRIKPNIPPGTFSSILAASERIGGEGTVDQIVLHWGHDVRESVTFQRSIFGDNEYVQIKRRHSLSFSLSSQNNSNDERGRRWIRIVGVV